MKKIVSVSLGAADRDHRVTLRLLGEELQVERIGTNGDWAKAARLLQTLDGKVDVLALGGVNFTLWAGDYRFPLRDGVRLAKLVHRTPLVDGTMIKKLVEPALINQLQQTWGWPQVGSTVLFSSVLDRFPLAAALQTAGCRLIIGDAMFALGLPLPFFSLAGFTGIARFTVPLLAKLPINRLYPLGVRQQQISCRFRKWYRRADILAGDFHFLHRYLPPDLSGKAVITSTLTRENIKELRERGVRWLATTAPNWAGRSFGANLLEAVLVALLDKPPEKISTEAYVALVQELGWRPRVEKLN